MALEGNLRDFSLEHVFQLINTGKKTGTLHIVRASGGAEAFVYFRQGRIFGAVSNFNRKPIGERLVQAGQITQDELEGALDNQKNGKQRRKLGQILVAEGLLTTDILKRFVREQIQSTVFDLLPWEEGEFQFDSELPPVEDMGLLVSAKKVLSEGSQRLDEWEKVREKVPSLGAVFSINEMAIDNTSVTLTAKHLKLIRHIDGERTVTELAMATKMSEFETCQTLYDLVGADIVKRAKGSGDSTDSLTTDARDESGPPAVAEQATTQDLSNAASLFHAELDDEGLDGMVADENSANRAAFVKELSSVTHDNGSGLRFSLAGRLGSHKKVNAGISKHDVNEAVELFSR